MKTNVDSSSINNVSVIESTKIKVVLVKPMERPIITEIDKSLKSLQSIVEGRIEAVYPFEEMVAVVCNEEGKINGLPLNRALMDGNEITDIVAGNFFICDASGDDFDSLNDEQLNRYAQIFKYPEQFYKINDQIRAIPIKPTMKKEHER